MLVKEIYKFFLTEESTVKYLQDYGLLPCAKQCHKCGSEVKQYQRNDRGKIREVFRCKKKVAKLPNRYVIIIHFLLMWMQMIDAIVD